MMMLLVILLSLLGNSASSYALAAEIPLTFEQAAQLALTDNADLLALRYQEEAQSLRASQQLAPNNPVFSLNRNDVREWAPFDQAAQTIYGLSWTLGFPGKALSLAAASRHQAQSLHEQTVAREIDTLAALSNTYAALSSNDRIYSFLVDEERKARDLVKLLEKKYSAGQAAQVDLLNQRVVVAQLQQILLVNRNERANLLTQFLNLIRKPGAHEYVPVVPREIQIPVLKQSREDLVQIMLRNRHALKAARQQVEAAGAVRNAALLAPLPDLQLATSFNFYNFPENAPIPNVSRDYSFGIGISIPIFFPFNELTGIRAASRDRAVAEAQHDSQRLQSLADLESLYTSFGSLQQELDNMVKLVLPAAKASYDLTLLTYSLGKADYFSLNVARATWIQAEKELLTKKVSLAQLFNQITQQLGCDITQKESPYACQ